MWEVLVRTPRGTFSPRKFSLLLATILMASFGYILATSPLAAAATDVTWEGDAVMYKSEAYETVQNTSQLPGSVSKSPAVYQRIEDSDGAKTVQFIYFSTTTPQDEKQATYVRYTLNPPNSYTNKAGEKTLSVTPVPAEERLDTDDGIVRDSCTIDGIGWMVCPVMNSISEGIDFIFERIRGFLVVQPISSDINNPVYRIWQVSRDFANIIFIIGFLVIIYNYIVGGGMKGYEVRKIIPRLVIAAVLINISYVICAVAVDISNIAGYGVNQLFEQVRDSALSGASAGDDVPVSWTSVTTWVLAGGIGTGVAIAALPGTIGGAAGLWYLLAPFLVGAALLVIVTFLILAARQAIIIIAIAIAPLAFAALILPNTEKWFERWRGLFFTMLIMFPAFAAVFGGAQLAGEIIIRSANSIELVILGLGVMVAPLAITPLLLKLGGGVLGRIGGIINNKEKGVVDRFRNYSGERRKDAIARHQAANAMARRSGNYGDSTGIRRAWRRRAGANYAKAAYRKSYRELNEANANNAWHGQTDKWGGGIHSNDTNFLSGASARGNANLDYYKRVNSLQHDAIENQHNADWNRRFDPADKSKFNADLYQQRLDSYTSSQTAKLAEDRYNSTIRELEAGNTTSVLKSIKDPAVRASVTSSLGTTATGLQDLNRSIVIEADRKLSADKEIQAQIAGAFKENTITIDGVKIRDYAGGIAGEMGANRVYARAKSEGVSAYMEDVKNSRSVLSEYTAKQLVKLHVDGVDREGNQVYNPVTGEGNTAIVDAALQEIALNKGNNWAFQKMRDRVADMGMMYDENSGAYYDMVRDAKGEVIRDPVTGQAQRGAQITDQKVIDRRRDVQQLFADAAKNTKLRVANLSQTEISGFETGISTTSSQEAIIRDIFAGKFDQSRIVNMDVDELQRMVQVIRDPAIRNHINQNDDQALGKLLKTIDGAQANKQINGSIKDRERGVMNAIAAYIDPQDAARTDKEDTYYVDPTNDYIRVHAGDTNAVKQSARTIAPGIYDPKVQ